ncbi:IclR family transcriptional regulator [Ulvibacterium sp.]|uniref:IclR family transcriptional regulator n=1 Tax=Ulvibacterium sp. TaxID=2665914 RepID=UPI003BAB4A7E
MSNFNKNKYSAPALDKGLDILEYLSKINVPASQLEIAEGIKKSSSEIYRMLVSLEDRGYIIRDTDSGSYRLSLKMYVLSHRHTPFDELKNIARYPMQTLSQKIKQSCHLSILYNNQLLVIFQVRSPSAVSLSIQEGTYFSLSMTTSGKVLLSQLPKSKRKEVLENDKVFRNWSKTEQTAFEKSLEQIKQDGYSYSKSKLTSGVTDVAVPIGSPDAELYSALAVSTLTSNLQEEINVNEILTNIKKAQSSIHISMGLDAS